MEILLNHLLIQKVFYKKNYFIILNIDTIRIVHNYLSNVIGTSTFSLMTTFPKKIYSPNNFEIDNITLENAGK